MGKSISPIECLGIVFYRKYILHRLFFRMNEWLGSGFFEAPAKWAPSPGVNWGLWGPYKIL